MPKTNVLFWTKKFEQNIKRDRKVASALRRLGFLVITVWQCQTVDAATLNRKLGRLQTRPVTRRSASSEKR